MNLLRRLLDPAYLYAIDPGPLGPWKWFYLAWAAALLAGAAGAWWGGRGARLEPDGQAQGRHFGRPRAGAGVSRGALRAAGWAFALGLAALLLRILAPLAGFLPPYARYLALEVWTARVWPLSATVAGLLALGVALLSTRRRPPLLARHVDALTGALSASDPSLPVWATVLLAAIHLAGLGSLWTLGGYAAWWAVPSLLALALLPWAVRPRRVRLETLAPLLPAYFGALGTLLLGRRLGIEVAEYQGFTFPDPWSPWTDVPALVVAGAGYTLWIQLRLLAARWQAGVRDRLLPALVCLLLVAWFAATVLVHRTHGVTASDPYSYVQMAIDLAETGSPLHAFPLAGTARDLGLPTWPAVHVGYHPPTMGVWSPTMWPIGWPLLMAPFYLLGGLGTLYFVAPLMQALSLVVVWLAAVEALRDQPRGERWAVAAATCLLVATSPEVAERMLVPMADAAAQLFTVLTLWLLLRALRVGEAVEGQAGAPSRGSGQAQGRRWRSQRATALGWSLAAGVAFGVAYLIRHPQLPLGVAALVTAWLLPAGERRRAWRQRLTLLLPFAATALVVALPDLLYHRAVFGGWLQAESSEWFLISGRNVAPSAFSLLEQGLLRREELGYLVPFLVVGIWRLWRRQRAALAVLGSGGIAVLAFHLFYQALRPRDLIPLLPVAYLCTALGLWVVWRWARRQGTLLAALCLLGSAVLLGVRSWQTLAAPWRDDVITFGHVSAAQRDAFERLRSLTPEDAVIGSMLNGGAIELHAGRGAVHPAPWSEDELGVWVDALLSEGRPTYVLDDGEEMGPVLRRLEGRYRLRLVAGLDLPYFAVGGGNLPRPATLYSVEGQARSP